MPDSPIIIIYASTSGHTETVCETIANIWLSTGQNVELMRAEQTNKEVILHNNRFVLATSTWAHGELNPFFKPLLSGIKELDCHTKKAGFIGLGDRRYEPVLFCGGMFTLREAWLQQGGEQAGTELTIQGEPFTILETTVSQWAHDTLPALQS